MTGKVIHLESIDVARGLAALSVATYHQGYGSGLAVLTGRPEFEWLAWPGIYLAVPLFFVISGFCIHLSGLARQDEPGFTRDFFLQRFFRIYPPWVSAVILSALVVSARGEPVSAWQWLTHLTLTNGFFDDYRLNPVLWSVSVESLLYLLYPAWLAFRRRRGITAGFLLGLAVSALSSAIWFWCQPVPDGPSRWFFLNVWCGWLAGAVLAEALSSGSGALLRQPAWWIAGSAACVLHIAAILGGVYRGIGAYALLPVTVMLCVWPLALLIVTGNKLAADGGGALVGRLWRALAWIGMFSYSLYLVHVPLQSFVYLLLPHLHLTFTKALLFAVWFGVVLLGAWLHFLWIEQPAAQLGRRIVAHRRSQRAAVPTILSA